MIHRWHVNWLYAACLKLKFLLWLSINPKFDIYAEIQNESGSALPELLLPIVLKLVIDTILNLQPLEQVMHLLNLLMLFYASSWLFQEVWWLSSTFKHNQRLKNFHYSYLGGKTVVWLVKSFKLRDGVIELFCFTLSNEFPSSSRFSVISEFLFLSFKFSFGLLNDFMGDVGPVKPIWQNLIFWVYKTCSQKLNRIYPINQ